MALWTAKDAAKATGGKATGGKAAGGKTHDKWEATGVSIDTRTLEPGDLFVALTAARDGHDFVAQALESGAAAAMVSRIPDGLDTSAPLLVVDDVQEGLEALGRAGRARTAARVIAVTGSVGKTSTKEMLRAMLDPQGATHASQASYNNHWGVPLTLARMPRASEYAVIEIGMNHPGEIEPLARLARPHVALITTVAPAHLEAFDDIAGIAREKASIFNGLEPGGVAVINNDQDVTAILKEAAELAGAQIVTFGSSAHITLEQARVSGDVTVVEANSADGPILFKLHTPGTHFAMNALGALAAVQAAGGDLGLAALDIARWMPVEGRGVRETYVMDVVDDHLRFDLIDDAFNANPVSMEAALNILADVPPDDDIGRIAKGRRIAVLGDMLELGPQEHELHAAIAQVPAMASVDRVYCVGPLMKTLHDALPPDKRAGWFEDAPSLAAKAHSIVDAGDVVLVKGSKGSKVSLVVDALRKLGHPLPANQIRAE
ncbi:UDP-N-acetylmuramoyl-tripeptide--D-alanyl-D-alanine ligase [Aliiroseovarius sp. PTFE2010]|uniref:UDP-N-acetylmuramoyl-tripeptide--D-alanyl-D- alanine ligase n=1 Tax=Aliiroseovarius sp. PTFE2010 TaxID=3417190 RepID=UPI003CEBFB33